jgi:hypothetical protein
MKRNAEIKISSILHNEWDRDDTAVDTPKWNWFPRKISLPEIPERNLAEL